MGGPLCSNTDSQDTNKHVPASVMPPVFSRPGGKENPALEFLSTPGTLVQRPGGGEKVVPIVSGSQENWGLSLLISVRRVGVSRCKVAGGIGCVLLLGLFWRGDHQVGLYGPKQCVHTAECVHTDLQERGQAFIQ